MQKRGALGVGTIVLGTLLVGSACDSGSGATTDGGTTLPDGAVVLPDGAVVYPDGSAPPPDGSTASCLGGALLAALGKNRLLVGGAMADGTASTTPIDVRYQYLSGGIADGSGPCASCATSCTAKGTTCANSGPGCAWWGCWQYDQNPPGAFVRDFVSKAKTAKQIPMLTYYMVLQASGVAEGSAEVTKTTDAAFMARYYADFRFFLQQIGQDVALVHVEPDFWGYAEQMNEDPHALPSAVASANATDCGMLENSIAGLGKCFVAMARKYAPNAKIGLHASAWATKMDVSANKNPSFDVAGEAKKVATFLGACGGAESDLIVVESSDRDAGYYQSIGQNRWWDETNAALPHFHQHLAWVKALTEAMGKPAMHWQMPLGNASLPNQTNKWKDNRVDYFFAHMDEVAAAHSVGVFFGAGAGDQTTPESDGGNFVAKVKAYASSPGQACQ